MMNRIIVDGKPFYMHGANYPWMVKDGKSNYGLDFGVNKWGTHEGVSTNMERVENDFAEMESLGFNTLRWFVFTDGRGGIEFDQDNQPRRLSEKVFDDFDAALVIARSHNIKIIFVLLDFLWMHDAPQPDSPNAMNFAHVLKLKSERTKLIERIFTPLFERYANHPNILAWEVMNEPDWIVKELDPNRKNVREPMRLRSFKQFVREVSDVVHSHTSSRVTVGGGRMKFIDVWDDDELNLDFLQVHTYNDFLNQKWDERLFDKKFSGLNLKRPLLVGEFSTNCSSAFENRGGQISIPLEEYLSFCYDAGYAGSLFWSFNSVDKCATESRESLKRWAERKFFLA